MDTPEKLHEFELIRWQLSHQDVFVFIEEGKWFIHLATTCQKLRPDNRCGVYETRPTICRDYSTEDCDFSGSDYQWSARLNSPAELREHLERYPTGTSLSDFPRLARLPWRASTPEDQTLTKPKPTQSPATTQRAINCGPNNHTGCDAREIELPMLAGQPSSNVSGNRSRDDFGPVHEVGIFIDTPSNWEELENVRWYVMHDRVKIRVDADDKWTLLYRTIPQSHCGQGHERCGTHCRPTQDAGEGRFPRILSDVESLMAFVARHMNFRKAAS